MIGRPLWRKAATLLEKKAARALAKTSPKSADWLKQGIGSLENLLNRASRRVGEAHASRIHPYVSACMRGGGIEDYDDWRPGADLARYVPHTWVAGWHEGAVEALVTEASDAAWECLVIESTSNGPISGSARDQIRSAGADIVGPDPDEIATRMAELDDVLRLRRYDKICRRREGRTDAGLRPLLVVVGDGDHVLAKAVEEILLLGREFNMHLAIDECARRRTAMIFRYNVAGMYRLNHVAQ